jgi:MFS transporter, Spinster family, sphingosine-1-phosphate transporter
MSGRTPSRAWILALLTAANFLGYASRNALFLAYDDLRAQFRLDDEALGQLGTAFIAFQAAATVPFGWAGDRYGRPRIIALGLVIASAAGAIGPLVDSFPALLVSRGLVGLGFAVVVPVANSMLAELFDGNVKASRIAVFNLGLFVGGAVGLAGGQFAGYPWILYLCAVPGFAVALAVAGLPRAGAPLPLVEGYSLRRSAAQLRELLRARSLRLLMVSTTTMAFAAGSFAAWFPEFLRHDKRLSEQQTLAVMGASLVAGLIGVLTGGRLGDRWRRRARAGRLWTIVLGMAATVPAVSVCILLPAGPGLVAASMATMFFVSWYHAPMAATVDDLARPERAATVQAVVVFTMHLLGTAPSSWVLGWLSGQIGLASAMWVPTAALGVSALAMMAAIPSFATDHERARPSAPAASAA